MSDSVESIGREAFNSCSNVDSITFGNNLQYIGTSSFMQIDALQQIVMPSSLQSIGNTAFYNCPALAEVTLNKGLRSIGLNSFSWTVLESVNIPASVEAIGDTAFDTTIKMQKITVDAGNKYYSHDDSGCLYNYDKTKLLQYPEGSIATEYTLPNTVTATNNRAFRYISNLVNICVQDGSTSYRSVDGVLFSYDMSTIVYYPAMHGLDDYVVPDGVQVVYDNAFNHVHVNSIQLPDTVTTLNYDAFSGCSATNISLGNSIETMGTYTFAYCKRLTSITVPASVRYIGAYTFTSCSNLENIIFENSSDWYCTQYSVNIGKYDEPIDLSDPQANVRNLTDACYYDNYFLYKL